MSGGSELRGGVDGGASGSRAAILEPEGEVRARADGPPAAVRSGSEEAAARTVAALVRSAADEGGIRLPLGGLCAGLAGAGTREIRDAVLEALRSEGVARAVRVVSDVEAARFDAFGHDAGIVVLAGTGAVTLGLGPSGDRVRADGWGPAAGDEGGGLDLARRALRAALRDHDGRGPPTRLSAMLPEAAGVVDPPSLARWAACADRRSVAGLAPAVIRAATAGDRPAARILADGASRLAAAVVAVHGRLAPWPAAAPLAAGGGLLAGSGRYRQALVGSLAGHPLDVRVDAPDAARGAARMAVRE